MRHALALVVGLLSTVSASAQEAAPTSQPSSETPAPTLSSSPSGDSADVHLGLAAAALKNGRPDVAATEFLAAYELCHDPNLLYEIGSAFYLADGAKAAAKYYTRFLHDAKDATPEQRRTARARIVEASPYYRTPADAETSTAQPGSNQAMGPHGQLAGTSSSPDVSFVTLDRMGAGGDFGLHLGYTSVDSENDLTLLRMEVYGAAPVAPGFGVYGQVAMARISGHGDSEEALNGAELGIYGFGSKEGLSFVGRLGIVAPTADDSFEKAITNIATGVSRLTDFTAALPSTTWLRLSGSALPRWGSTVLRVDSGLDFPVDSDHHVVDVFGHLNFGVAFVGPATFSVELVNMARLTGDGELSDRALHTFTLGADFVRHVQIGLGIPIDKAVRNDLPFFASIGLHGQL